MPEPMVTRLRDGCAPAQAACPTRFRMDGKLHRSSDASACAHAASRIVGCVFQSRIADVHDAAIHEDRSPGSLTMAEQAQPAAPAPGGKKTL
ncbi:MAG: hypothetical protein KJZ68_03550, partial [Phycisphaerales bacterium]|nr:hypothetical protein [Phycisphaerales bacterium]